MKETSDTLSVTHLQCIRQQHIIFNSLSFELHAGEVLFIEGPNGSGKSSLLRLLTGLSTPSLGDIRWCGKAIKTIYDDYTQQFHYIAHTNGIKQGLTVAENIQLTQHLSLTTSSLPLDLLTSLQLTNFQHTLVKQLSAGQQRRVALAKLFLLSRKLWLLDEPLTALDTTTQTFFLSQLETHLQQGGMAVMSSHQSDIFNSINVNVKPLRLKSC